MKGAVQQPRIFKQKIVTARKQHNCTECTKCIEPRFKYEYTFGIWDKPEQFKLCLDCVEKRNRRMIFLLGA